MIFKRTLALSALLAVVMGAAVPASLAAAAETTELSVRELRRQCWGAFSPDAGEPVLSACGRLIDTGALRGDDLLAAHQYRGIALAVAGRPAEAVLELERVARERPHAEVFRDLAWVWLKLDDHERARENLDRAETYRNVQWRTLSDMGLFRADLGDTQGAIRNYRASLRAGGGAVQQNGLCWHLAVANQSLDEALRACDRAIRDEPRSAAYIDSRALVKMRLGDFEGAEADYISAVALDPKQSLSLYGRGLARIHLGRVAQGRADIARATRADPSLPGTFAAFGLAED